MTIVEQLAADTNTSLKAGDSARTGTLRLLSNALGNERIKLQHELSDDEAIKVLQREAKQRRDSIAAYEQAGRTELAAAEEAELAVIALYLPQPLSPDELNQLVEAAVAEVGDETPAAMGRIIAAVMAKAAGRAEGGQVAAAVRARLGLGA